MKQARLALVIGMLALAPAGLAQDGASAPGAVGQFTEEIEKTLGGGDQQESAETSQGADQQSASDRSAAQEDRSDAPDLDDVWSKLRAGQWAAAGKQLWRAKLFNAGDTAIHVDQLVIALLVLLIGLMIAKRIARIARVRLVKFKRVDNHAAALIQRLLYYVLVVIVVLVALPIAGIPITIFTVLGGAVAIGVGFGAQNLFNNLISSLIIMVEKPIRIGDIIEIGGVDEGRVEDIGNRCTRIRRSDGMDVLIPNSHFLENPVVNWTLFDIHVRGSVDVGVAYGSPTAKVRDLIMKAASEHPKVLQSPEPIVLFESFGDNALAFKLMFWADITAPMQLRVICSDLRYTIDGLFRETDITISFPQRDVHLDTLKPLEVRMVEPDK